MNPGRPLEGVKVVEFSSLGPIHHAGMLLADMGAAVTQLDRPGVDERPVNPVLRGRTFIGVDLKTAEGRDLARQELADADVLIEGFRPGVMERLGLGPADVAAVNPRLVYGRMTGWGQEGPLASKAGHDINFLATTGVLNAIRVDGSRPTVPLNLAGDNGGGSVYLVMGVLAALFQRQQTGRGTVIDASIVDGASSLLQTVRGLEAEGQWTNTPAANLFDSGAPFYDTYVCADGLYMAVGAIEPKFYARLLEGLGLERTGLPAQSDRSGWGVLRAAIGAAFATETREHWSKIFDDLDACVSPVLDMDEATRNEHLLARGTLTRSDAGVWAAAPAPRFAALEPDHRAQR